jgi:partitioning defective protein 3
MKVTVSFNTVKIVVPCGDGEKTVRELTQLATIRYKKATGKPRLSWVSVHSLKAKEGGILDPDDRLVDVCDDREQLIAFYDEEGIPQCGDGMSASSDESETTSGSYNKNDIEVSSGEYGAPAVQLQVRRGSEPALNKLEAGQLAEQQEEHVKRWSAAGLINRDSGTQSSKNDLSVINEASYYGNSNFDFDPGGGGRLSPLPPPFERGQGSGAARDSDRPNPFARDANRLSIQIGHEDGRWLEAAERAERGPSPNRGFEPPPPSSRAIEADFGPAGQVLDSRRLRREPLGGTSPPRASSEDLARIVIQNEIGPLGIHVVPSGDPEAAGLLIQGIEPGGRIDRDGRLAVHDRIVEINGYSLTEIPFHKAQEIFKDALFTKELSLVVEKSTTTELSPDAFDSEMFHPDEPEPGSLGRRAGSVGAGSKAASSVQAANTRKIGKKLTVSLVKGVHGLGFSITTRDIQAGGVTPIYIKNILPKGAAIENGQLRPGDRLLEVNSESMDGRSQGEVVAILRNTPQYGEVSLVVSRQERVEEIELSTMDRRAKERSSGRSLDPGHDSKESTAPNTEESEEYTSISPDVSVNSNGEVVFPWKHREILTLDIPVHDTERAGLGVSVKGKTTGGGPNKSIVDLGIFVKSVIHGGAASRDGRLKTNDQLVNINGISLLGKANCDAMDTLRRAMHEEGPTPGVITLTVARRLLLPASEQGRRPTGRDSVTSVLTSSSGEDSFREYRIGANNTTNSFDNSQNETVIYVEKPKKPATATPVFDNFLTPAVPRNPVVDRLMGGGGARRPKEQDNGRRNESYYRATGHDTWNSTMLQQLDSPDAPARQLKSPTVHVVGGETVMIEQFDRQHSPEGAERSKLSDSEVMASQVSLQEEDMPGFARDQPGRRSMSEKRHATLDAKSTDTYQRSKKARAEREQAAAEGEVGPTLGMKKSSSLESLQTMMLEMKMETARPPATRAKGSRVVRYLLRDCIAHLSVVQGPRVQREFPRCGGPELRGAG